MKNIDQNHLYQKLIDNPKISFDDLMREYNDEWFLKMLLKDGDINILKNSNIETINKELDNISTSQPIKNLMKKIFEK